MRVPVVHVITLLELGGAQENTLDTVAGLDRTRYDCTLVAGAGGRLDDRARSIPGVRAVFLPSLVREVSPAKDLRAFRALRRLFLELRPRIVHTHSSKAGILGRWAAAAAGVPIVVHSIHGWSWSPSHGALSRTAYVFLEWLTAGVTTHFVAVSRANRDEGVARGFFPEGRATVIRSGFDVEAFRRAAPDRAEARRELGFPPDAPLVGMIACFKPQKAPIDFVRIASRVAAARPDARFVAVGDGELRGGMEAEVASHRLEGVLRLAGWREDVPRLLASMDVLVLPSLWEGLPRVVPQALAAGVPVVATNVNGTPETIVDGQTGYLFEPHDVQLAAARVCEILRNPSKGRTLAEAGRRSLEDFGVDRLVSEQDRLYRSLLE